MIHAGIKLTGCCGRARIDCQCDDADSYYDSDDREDDEEERDVCDYCGKSPSECENYLLHQMKLTEDENRAQQRV